MPIKKGPVLDQKKFMPADLMCKLLRGWTREGLFLPVTITG